jgi:hypothetical protein
MTEIAVYDPRDPAQDPREPETWKPTDNPALIQANLFYGALVGRGDQRWDKVAELADWCDEPIENPKEIRHA